MFGGPPDAGGSAGPSGRQPHGRPPTSPSVDPAAGAPHGFYGQPQAYQQQWLPAQFAGFSLGGQTYYAPAPGMPGSPVLAGPGPGPDTYMAAMQPHLQMPLAMGVPPEGMAPRGWGGVQLHDQQHDRGYGGRGGGRGGYQQGGGRGGAPRGTRGGGRRGRNFYGGGAQQAGDAAYLAEDLLMRLKRLPSDAPLDSSVLQGLERLGSRGLAQVFRDLGKAGLAHRAAQMFDAIHSLGPGHALAPLLDEFTYTSLISTCGARQDLQRALALAEEMRERGIPRNVHTYSALMNVCIKCGQYKLALEVYSSMRAAGCPANVVTWNTLIDVYGKSGQWEEALGVLAHMKAERCAPVTRTYNTLMIACNTSNQWQEALRLHEEMRGVGLQPNTTTYNALISAHSKAGDLSKVLQAYKEMVQEGCERSVITYSSLISACEKAGEWKLALQLFEEMRAEGCTPNVISYNSLITACAQGAQWEKAAEVFEQMQRQGCRPDVVTVTALIQAFERGGQWRRALAAFEDMRARGCAPDAIVYNTIIDVLWETGVAWAQRRAARLFRQATQEGLVRRHSHVCAASLELNLHSTSTGVALLSLHAWLEDLTARGPDLPPKVCIIAGRSKGKEGGGLPTVKDCMGALLRALGAPFKEAPDSSQSIGRLEASGQEVAEWLLAEGRTALAAIVPPPPSAAGADDTYAGEPPAEAHAQGTAADAEQQVEQGGAAGEGAPAPSAAVAAAAAAAAAVAGLPRSAVRGDGSEADAEAQDELSIETKVTEAFRAVRLFEETHCLNVQIMPASYKKQRPELIAATRRLGEQLKLPDETVYDAVLLLDRAMSVPLTLTPSTGPDGALAVAAAACLHVVATRQAALPAAPRLDAATVAQAAGVAPQALAAMQTRVMAALGGDTASVSAHRCLLLSLERLGGAPLPDGGASSGGSASDGPAGAGGAALRLLREALADPEFLNYRPSVVAAAALQVERRARGLAPYWPSALATLTGYTAQSRPELAAAVAGAQRVHDSMQIPAAVLSYASGGGVAADDTPRQPAEGSAGGDGPGGAPATPSAPSSSVSLAHASSAPLPLLLTVGGQEPPKPSSEALPRASAQP